jgi:hypothetical protein
MSATAGLSGRVLFCVFGVPCGRAQEQNTAGQAGRGTSAKCYRLMCTTFAGGNPLKYVDEAWL